MEQNAVKALEAVFKWMVKNGFNNVFQACQKQWDRRISLSGEYIKGDKCSDE